MTVRVANDFKTEAQHAHEQLALDNKSLREKIRNLEQQIEKLNKSEFFFFLNWNFFKHFLDFCWKFLKDVGKIF